MRHQVVLRFSGQQGMGIQSVATVAAGLFSSLGYRVRVLNDFESRIVGGYTFTQMLVSTGQALCVPSLPDLVFCIAPSVLPTDLASLPAETLVFTDTAKLGAVPANVVPFPASTLLPPGQRRAENMLYLGAMAGILRIAVDALAPFIASRFARKGDAVVQANLAACRAGHAHAASLAGDDLALAQASLPPGRALSGNEALTLGAVAAGVGLYAGYPMSPATSIMEGLARLSAQRGIFVEQAEDEIAAANIALGAAYAGVRAMTATSGGGLSLMTETVSMAAIAELPVVFVNVQRPGPATGLATRTAQGDLSMVLSMGHGEFSRAVLTPGTPERAFVAAQKAFYLAEKYQVPVFLLSDQHLADSLVTCTGLEVVPRFQERFLKTTSDLEEPSQVRRYLDTPAGVPPRPVPGLTNDLVVADSHVHDELGHITEDPEVSGRLLARLAGKERRMVADMDLPEVAFDQPASPDVLLIGWGSTHGALRHATVRLRESGLSANHLHFHELHPLDWPRVAEMLRAARTTVCVENNATGQLARLLRSEICFNPTHTVLRWDGRPFYADRLLDAIRRLAP